MNVAALRALLDGDLANAIVASTPGGVERQEAAGQHHLVSSDILPREIRATTRDDMAALGFVFGRDVDDVFVECEPPAGWSKVPTDHSMWSRLVDAGGTTQAMIFYKAAFYDRCATLYWGRTT